MVVVRHAFAFLVVGTLGFSGAAFGQAPSPNDPPGRVGRLAFTQGTVSFHDAERTDWEPAMVNTPLSSGDAIWTEPNAHGEISIAGTRVRMDGATQLDMVSIDDQQTRLQVDQGRVDIKTFAYDARQPYDLVTPRGVATLQQQGDYYVEAGSTQDPTRLGVRAGAAQFQAPDGRVLAVRAGEVVEVTGDGGAMELHTIHAPPPPMPQYWAERDRVVVYDQPQYLSASVTGYEELNYYGSWQNDPEYGQVWYVRDAPSDWAPYTTGRWDYQPVYGWTWIDEQPWGFAPYHYGRWAQRNNRWFWVPPERAQPAVYAPALVAFMGGTELGLALGAQNRQPVGWFPLGPHEAYIPPYTANRDYYRRLNLADRVQANMLEDRWERAQRHEAVQEQQQNWMNRRFATVVPADAFARSQPVERAAIRVSADTIAAAPVAAIAAPPAPNQSIRALIAPSANNAASNAAPRPNAPNQVGPGARTTFAAMQALKPEPQAQKAPGPQIATRAAVNANVAAGKPALPRLEPRNASAPALPQIQGERRPASPQPSPQANAPTNRLEVPPLPGEPNRAQPGQPSQANLPPVRERNEQRPEPPHPGQPAPGQPAPGHPAGQPQANTQPNGAAPHAQPQGPVEPPRPPQVQAAPQPQPQRVQPPQPPHQSAPQPPQHQQQLQREPQPSAPPPQMQQHAPAPPPQQTHAPSPPPQMQQHAPAPPQQAQTPHPQPAPQQQQQQKPQQSQNNEKK